VPTSSPLVRVRDGWLSAALLMTLFACSSEPLPPAHGAGGGGSGGEASNGGAGAPAQDELAHLSVLEQAIVSSDTEAENFQQATAMVDFGSASVSNAMLHVELTSPCFPFSNWIEEGVPAGQRWPARCDAFDRTLTVSLDDAAPGETPPGFELVRAITPFGGPLTLDVDVTDLVNGLPGEHRLRLGIDTWSDADGLVSGSNGEWQVSVAFDLTYGAAPRRVLTVLPLVLEAQTEVEAEPVSFEVPEGVGSARLDYRVTGHGAVAELGCIGPAEEFCKRTHELRLDGALLDELLPWRSDCAELCTVTKNDVGAGPASYCAENPCGAPASVRAPRANWCPGSMTAPFAIESPLLAEAGAHELTRTIQGLREGGQWRVSATYFAFE
jgi:hypothetical protein